MDKSLQEWADMYNKKDKEHFECQLKLTKTEQKLEKIKNILFNTAWINIGNQPKKAIEEIHKILKDME